MIRVYITTAIPYLNDSPHFGHLYEFILADIFARYQRLKNEVFFQSGTDENGLKIVKSAEEKGQNVKDFVDERYKEFYSLKEKFNLSFDNFIRTTSPEHKLGVYKLWKLCEKDIYQGEYRGFYCLSCESYYDENEAPNFICPIHKKPLEKFEERNYFFKLSKYLDEVKNLIEKDKIKIYPEERKKEVLNILKEGKIGDLSISREASRSKGWGIPVEKDPSQVIYVWFDALVNYISGLGFGSDDETLFKNFWEEGKIYHFIGKDIVKFHAIYWPAMLLSAGLKVPDYLVVHSFVTVEGEKMSKTLGNVIFPDDFLKKYPYEAVRFYLIHQPWFKDWDFSWKDFENFYQGVLKNNFANLIHRIFGLLRKFDKDEIELLRTDLDSKLEEFKENFENKMESLDFNEAYSDALNFVQFLNKFIDQQKIWETKSEKDLSFLIKALNLLLEVYFPVLPEKISFLKEKLIIHNQKIINQKIDLPPLYP